MVPWLNSAHIFLLLCWINRATAECNTAGSLPQCDSTTALPKSVFYSLTVSSPEYSTSPGAPYSSTSAISVRVGMTACPSSLESPGPKWYKLEAISELTNQLAGTFDEPVSRSEAHLCEGSIIFSSCEPFVLDLPRIYGWNAPLANVGNICFRLTILKDGMEICEQISKCISPEGGMNSSGDGIISSGNLIEANKDHENEHENANPDIKLEVSHTTNGRSIEHCYERWNCTNKRKRDFCANDGNTYPSRCAFRLQECITDTDLTIKHMGKCITPTTMEPEPEPTIEMYCRNDKRSNQLPWDPKCSCDGSYKPIQCFQNSCWCSTLRGYQTIRLGHWCDDPNSNDLLKCLPSSRR